MKVKCFISVFILSVFYLVFCSYGAVNAVVAVSTSSFVDEYNDTINSAGAYPDVESWKTDFQVWLNLLGIEAEDPVYGELAGINSFDAAERFYTTYANAKRMEARDAHWGYFLKGKNADGSIFYDETIYSGALDLRIRVDDHPVGINGCWVYFQCDSFKCSGSLDILQFNFDINEDEYRAWYDSAEWDMADPFDSSAIGNQYPSIYSNLNYKNEFAPDKIFKSGNTSALMNLSNADETSTNSKFKLFLPPGVGSVMLKFKFPTFQCLPPEAPLPVFGETTLTINKINHSPANPEENNTVTFSTSITGNPSSYSWEIDGTPVSAQSGFSHKFTEEGSYSVRLTVTDSSGNEDTKSITVHVQAEPTVTLAISAITPSTSSPFENDTVSFSASFTGSPSTYSWTIDGVPVSNQATFSHTFAEEGDYAVSLTVTDASGNEATKEYTLHVKNGTEPITASIKASIPNIDNPLEIAFIALDASGEPLSTGYGYEWDFGGISTDQTYIAEPRVLFPAGGAYEIKLAVNGEAQPSKTITLNQQNPINVYFYDENNETDLSFRIPELHLFNSPASEEWVPFRDIVFYLKPGTELLWTLTPGE